MAVDKTVRLGFDAQAHALVKQMTLAQKVHLMSGNMVMDPEMMRLIMEALATPEGAEKYHYNVTPYEAGGIPEMELPPMKFADGPRGVVPGIRQSTCFPVSMARGAAFDTDLEYRVGRAIGKEVLAHGGNLFAGVCINLPYNPGWGRSQETYGEESYHLGRMGAALVRGVQDENVMACVKHYAFNSMEISRFKASVECGVRTEREVFLPHFKDCVDAGCAAVMTAYNKYKGVNCGHSKYLMTDVLRKEWGFDGFIMSDFVWGIRETVAPALNGMDIEMMDTHQFGQNLIDAVTDGRVPMGKIDAAAVRVARTILAFDAGLKRGAYPMSLLSSKEHVALAREVAEKSITLIKNDRVLPLGKDIKTVALVGKLAATPNIGDYGSSRVFPPYIVTPLEGLKRALPGADIRFYDGADIEAAKAGARGADHVIFVVGYDHDDEGEYISESQMDNYTGGMGGDRRDLGLHADEIALIEAVAPENAHSTVVLVGGNTILLDDSWYGKVNAVLMSFYSGMEGGNALADILTGAVNPSGKLPYVTPVRAADLPQVDWDTESQFYDYYHGYAKLDKEGVAPKLPYGWGMSYTSYAYGAPTFTIEGADLVARATVENVGDREGEEAAQMYVGFENSSVDRPLRLLRGFARVRLKPGEKREVTFACPIEKLKWYNPDTELWELEHMVYNGYVGPDADPARLKATAFIL
jgi:beta-glucosidase